MYVIKVLYTVGVTFNVCDKGVVTVGVTLQIKVLLGVTFNVCDKGVVYSRSYLQCM